MRKFNYQEENVIIDEGYIFGRGVFETILISDGIPIFFKEHIERLNKGIALLDIGDKVNEEYLLKKLMNLKESNCAIKFIVTPKNIVMLKREVPYTQETYSQGFKLKVSKIIRNSTSLLTYVKSINYIENILENKKCKKEGYDEVLFLNENKYVTEGSTSNIFMVKNKKIYTPKTECGLLNGVVRNFIIKNTNAIETNIKLEELVEADEVFITNSLIGIMKVTAINNKMLNNHAITNNIKCNYEKFITQLGGAFYDR